MFIKSFNLPIFGKCIMSYFHKPVYTIHTERFSRLVVISSSLLITFLFSLWEETKRNKSRYAKSDN